MKEPQEIGFRFSTPIEKIYFDFPRALKRNYLTFFKSFCKRTKQVNIFVDFENINMTLNILNHTTAASSLSLLNEFTESNEFS